MITESILIEKYGRDYYKYTDKMTNEEYAYYLWLNDPDRDGNDGSIGDCFD